MIPLLVQELHRRVWETPDDRIVRLWGGIRLALIRLKRINLICGRVDLALGIQSAG